MINDLKQKISNNYYWVAVKWTIIFFVIEIPLEILEIFMIMGKIEGNLWVGFIILFLIIVVGASSIIYFLRLFKSPFQKFQQDYEEYEIQRFYSENQLFDMISRGNQIAKGVWLTQEFLFYIYYGELRVVPYIMIKKMNIRYQNKSIWKYNLFIYKKENEIYGITIFSGSKKNCNRCLMMIDEQKRRCMERIKF